MGGARDLGDSRGCGAWTRPGQPASVATLRRERRARQLTPRAEGVFRWRSERFRCSHGRRDAASLLLRSRRGLRMRMARPRPCGRCRCRRSCGAVEHAHDCAKEGAGNLGFSLPRSRRGVRCGGVAACTRCCCCQRGVSSSLSVVRGKGKKYGQNHSKKSQRTDIYPCWFLAAVPPVPPLRVQHFPTVYTTWCMLSLTPRMARSCASCCGGGGIAGSKVRVARGR